MCNQTTAKTGHNNPPDRMDYGRAQTAIAMAKGEGWQLLTYLRAKRDALQREIEEIDRYIAADPLKHTNSWYDTIVRENDERRKSR